MNKVVYSKKIKSREGRLMMKFKSECCWIPTIFCKSKIRRIYRLILSWIRFGKSTFIITHLQSAVSHANTVNSYFLRQNTELYQNLSSDSVFNADIDTAPTTLVECQQAQISLLVTVAAAYPTTAPISVQNECTFSSAGE